MRSGADVETRPGELDNKQITRLHQLLHEAKFKEPDGSHLSPAGCPPVCQCLQSFLYAKPSAQPTVVQMPDFTISLS